MPCKYKTFVCLTALVLALSGLLKAPEAAAAAWPEFTRLGLKVCWESPDFTEEKQWVADAISREYETRGLLKVVSWGDCDEMPDANVRLTIADQNPHTMAVGPGLDRLDHGVVLNFTFKQWGRACKATRRDCIEGIAVHEFGHVLGLGDAAVPSQESQANCDGVHLAEHSDQEALIPTYFDSVMNYCNPNWRSGKLSTGDVTLAARLLAE